MVNLNMQDLDSLERIGGGGFGTLYRKDSLVYKIYNKDVKTFFGENSKNPSLKYRPMRLQRMMSVDREIKNTDLIQDVIFIDNKFAGVVIPFYNGITLNKLMDISLSDKIKHSYQLVRNTKELTAHFVYPMDFKLDNIMLVDDEIKLIDLDDLLTKVRLTPHLIKKKFCIHGLDDTIKTYLGEYGHISLPADIREKIYKPRLVHNGTYKDIEKYLKEKEKKHNYIFISSKSDLFSNLKLLRNPKYRVICICKGSWYEKEYLDNVIKELNRAGINLYDFVLESEVDNYIINNAFDEYIEIEGTRKAIRKGSK